ncbi:hypothetical protein [Clostridium sp.]|uniref:hypothetical protein n=1 Tax=Clostridium sp. TaxID=1506 RepID=UPI003F2A525D
MFKTINKEGYTIFESSKPNCIRLDIQKTIGTLPSDIEELRQYDLNIYDSWEDNSKVTYYIEINEQQEIEQSEKNLNALKSTLEAHNISIDSINGFGDDEGTSYQLVIKGFDYDVHIDIDNIEFTLSTVNTNIDWDSKQDEDIYFEYYDRFKNRTTRKTINSVVKYIEKYI